MLFRTGCGQGTRFPLSVYERFCIIQILIASNSRQIGIISKQGRYAATYAHRDIAFEFASWISLEFKLYIIEDYQRLKQDENSRLSLNWNLRREIAKLNYRIQTDAIKDHLIPPKFISEQIIYKYAMNT